METRRSSVDEADIEKFERLGADWWDPHGPMRPLHKLNPVRVAFVRDELARHFPATDGSRRDIRARRPLAGLSIVEIGCGGGILCEPLARLGAQMVGIDPAAGNIDIARRHAEAADLAIDYRATTAEDLTALGTQFDAVLAMEVVEHVIDMPGFVKTVGSLVRPGGLLFAATLNRTLKSFALAIVGAEYVLGWLPKGTHQWEKFVTPGELAEAMGAADIEVVRRAGVTYRPLIDEWRLSTDTAVNYMAVGERRT
ncbi:MAG TPA: bifunctional 2-polyprenyl-6-hydroxyphenol methylase/3-demethylubiquinol 3-O-methyltransferase UbiG [Beijerinckiaceae bacterium]|jgi:2-polyprenyl-6-hydroxyphenyl methylase/3-demethylubiquinone-9 3-methyltransferase|nr:bifunctional 2-polyprenyl-6-hydroxyphenol methylase/3-demethylubiquinol 3-O-methyltransferase UbiG [Beijerinckiaceae bacterium]